jgi:hypothetical protein
LPNGADLEQEVVVHPGGNPAAIQVTYRGASGLDIGNDGSLLIHTQFGDLRETPPKLYQELDGNTVAIEARFKLLSKHSYTFDIAPYSKSHILTVDPTLLYSTLVGEGRRIWIDGTKIAVDGSNNVYITGATSSTSFPTTTGSFQPTHTQTNWTSFITKLHPSGSTLVYSTFLADAASNSIAVNSQGEAYVAGWRFGSHPTTDNAFSLSGAHFVTKLSAAGDRLLYSTGFGSDHYPAAYEGPRTGLAVDSNGRAYITGTAMCDLPTTTNAIQVTCPNGGMNGFVSIFDPSKSGTATLVYSTYLPGSAIAYGPGNLGIAIAVDSSANAYVAGYASPGFLTTPGAYQSASPASSCRYYTSVVPCWVTFVAKINPSMPGRTGLVYSTYVGGGGDSTGTSIAVDGAGSAYISSYLGPSLTGTGAGFPSTSGSYEPCPTSSDNTSQAAVVKLSPAGDRLVYSTCIGGSGNYPTGL